MGKRFGGNLTDYGQTGSLHGKLIEAYYRAPKEEWKVAEDMPDFDALSVDEILALVPDHWRDDTSEDYWLDERKPFSGKDGQTNAYVKRGVDDEVEEYLPRAQTNKIIWHFATDDNHIRFLGGGKIQARGRWWFILKVIGQDSTMTMTNKFTAMSTKPNNKRLLKYGLKTLVLV